MSATPALSLRHVGKTYASQVALADVTLDVGAGEVRGLVGENGCGKSTLIKCLSGYHAADPGSEIQVAGQSLSAAHSPRQAREAGLAFVHQDLGLIDQLTVLENMALGRGFAVGAGWRIRWRQEEREARTLLEDLGVDVSPNAPLRTLSQADKTLVAIARGLRDTGQRGRVLVLDEPTAALPDAEVARLFAFVRRLQDRGLAVIYVSHRFNEVLDLCQRVSVLRDSRLVGTFEAAELDERSLVTTMVGRPIEELISRPHPTARPTVLLSARGLSARRLSEISFDLHEGEILGIAGLLGAGRSELARVLTGSQPAAGGELTLADEAFAPRTPRDAIERGVVMVPEDRRRQGAVMSLPVGTNMTLPSMRAFFRGGRLRLRQERAAAQTLIEAFDIRPADAAKPFYQLSGGNQQKVVLAKWMRLEPRVVVFDEPVQGVDVGAKAQIYTQVKRAAATGAGVILIDSDLEDLPRICDRVLIMRGGRVLGSLQGDELTHERIVELVYVTGEDAAA